jgi:hypothetical protein
MLLRITGAVAVMAAIATASTLPIPAAKAQTPQSEPATTPAAKPPTARQQRMKDCAVKWQEEKAEKHISGRDAYRAFMKECLKG